jgi:hypothetical protein
MEGAHTEKRAMGKLIYARPDLEIDIADRALLHLQLVIGAKLRRGESFFFSWKEDVAVGSGRSSIWLTPALPLYFRFSESNLGPVNRDWIDVLATSSNSGRGLVYTEEPGTSPSWHPRGHV